MLCSLFVNVIHLSLPVDGVVCGSTVVDTEATVDATRISVVIGSGCVECVSSGKDDDGSDDDDDDDCKDDCILADVEEGDGCGDGGGGVNDGGCCVGENDA